MKSPMSAMLAAAAAIMLGAPADAQQQSRAMPPADIVPDDIVVEGYRNRPNLQTKANVPVAISTSRNRATYAVSELLAKCAARSRLSDLKQLREVVDGEFNTATMLMA